jgi:hypothetical protein
MRPLGRPWILLVLTEIDLVREPLIHLIRLEYTLFELLSGLWIRQLQLIDLPPDLLLKDFDVGKQRVSQVPYRLHILDTLLTKGLVAHHLDVLTRDVLVFLQVVQEGALTPALLLIELSLLVALVLLLEGLWRGLAQIEVEFFVFADRGAERSRFPQIIFCDCSDHS